MPNVHLGPHFDRFVHEQIERGRFQNASEVVRAGLRLLEEHEASHAGRLAELQRQINEAFDDPSSGRPAGDVFNELEARYRQDGRRKAPEHSA